MAEARKPSFVDMIARPRKGAEPPPLREPESAEILPFTGESIATELRRARQEAGADLERVADDLKIRRVYLQAIEEGRFDDLPGATYAVGFVRAYADYLGLDGQETVRRFRSEVDSLNERLQLVFPTPIPDSRMPGGAVLLISALLVAIAYGGWFYLSSDRADLTGWVPEVPERLDLDGLVSEPFDEIQGLPGAAADPPAEPAPEVAVDDFEVSTASPTGTAAAEDEAPSSGAAVDEPRTEGVEAQSADVASLPPPSPEAPAAANEGKSETMVQAAPEELGLEPATAAPPAEQRTQAAIPAAPSPEGLLADGPAREPRIYGAENVAARVVLRATLDSWVQVRDASGDLLLTRVMQPGDTYRVPDEPDLTLLTGNAGGLEIVVDGKPLPSFGPIGAVRRDISLDANRLLSGTANVR